MKESLKRQYLWAVFALGLFLLNYPVLAIYNIPETWMGIPMLFLMVFSFWIMLILLTFLIIRKVKDKKDA